MWKAISSKFNGKLRIWHWCCTILEQCKAHNTRYYIVDTFPSFYNVASSLRKYLTYERTKNAWFVIKRFHFAPCQLSLADTQNLVLLCMYEPLMISSMNFLTDRELSVCIRCKIMHRMIIHQDQFIDTHFISDFANEN